MSLTIQQPLDLVQPAYQPITYVATPDTTVGRTNYTVRFNVIVDSEIIGSRIMTLGTDDTFTVDVSDILQTQLSDDIPTGSETAIVSASNSIVSYTINALEYWDVDNILTLQSGSTTTDEHWAFPGAYEPTNSNEFLTDITKIYKNGYMYLGFITNETTGIYAKINGSTIIPLASGETIEKLALVPLNSAYIGSDNSITVQVFDSLDAAISELYSIDVVQSCYPDPVTLQFRNKYGMIDCYTFSSYDSNRKKSSVAALYDNEWFNYHNTIDNTKVLYGDYEDNDTRMWMYQLFKSRYIYDGGDGVRIVSDNYVDVDSDLWRPVIQIQTKEDYLN